MLNLFLYHLASGQAWFSCGLLVLLIAALDTFGNFDKHPRLVRLARLLLVIAVLLAGASATPAPLWLAIPLAISCLAYIGFGFAHPVRQRRIALATCAGFSVLAALAVELPYHLAQPPHWPRPQRLYIVSDSLAAGRGREQTTWPRLLAARTPIDVRDLSFQGANTRLALRKLTAALEGVDSQEAWVLVSIGGNDMLGRTSAEDFGKDLEQLLAVARGDPARPRTVIMQELPLIPGAWAFGAEQRRLAAKFEVVLIPKRLLAGVVLTEENVVDGLHLSAAGHERMAELLAQWVGGS
jgi:acyl-CoA thioesterase I